MKAAAIAPGRGARRRGRAKRRAKHPCQPPLSSHGVRDQPPAAISKGFFEASDWSKYLKMPAFSSNNRGNAYRIFLELEQSQFKTDKP